MADRLDPKVESYFAAMIRENTDPFFLEVWRDNPTHAELARIGVHLVVALITERPLYLLVPYGARAPEGLLRIARVVEYFRPNDLTDQNAAVLRVLSRAERDADRSEA
jgi:hypothetical protein